MASQNEEKRIEEMIEAPGEAQKAARSLEEAAASNQTLQGYYAVNNAREGEKPEEGRERE